MDLQHNGTYLLQSICSLCCSLVLIMFYRSALFLHLGRRHACQFFQWKKKSFGVLKTHYNLKLNLNNKENEDNGASL